MKQHLYLAIGKQRAEEERDLASAKLGGHLPAQQTRCVTRGASGFGTSRGLENKALSSLPPGWVIWTCCKDFTPWLEKIQPHLLSSRWEA